MSKQDQFMIRKASGEKEVFSFSKLKNSLIHSKAPIDQIDEIITEIKSKLFPGITTKEIYRMAFDRLKKEGPHYASRYHLKNGIMELGPSGFPFEKFVAELFKFEGYAVTTDVLMNGKCVNHEVDIVCKKGSMLMLMECKYKNQQGVPVDVKVPLYIKSRFEDLLENDLLQPPFTSFRGWIVTNSKFTGDAISYGTCRQMELLGWNYPLSNSLKDRIDRSGLYPLTCLTTLTDQEKKRFLAKNIILVQELSGHSKFIERLKISPIRFKKIEEEIQQLLNLNNL